MNSIKSLKFKLVMILCLTTVITISIFTILGSSVLEYYYVQREKAEFVALYNAVKQLTDSDSADIIFKLSQLSANSTTTVMISDSSFTEIYSSSNIFGGQALGAQGGRVARNFLKNFAEMINLPPDKSYDTKIIPDTIGTQRIIMVGRLSSDHLLFLSKPLESVRNSVKIYNRFLHLISFFIIIIGSICMFFIATKLVKPIYEMYDISKRITNLDFSKRYVSKGEDELQMLGESLNTMSDRLSENILELSKANVELQNDLTQKERNEEMRKEFLQNASHELKTPIAVIASYTEMLMDKIITTEDECEYYYSVIYDETRKMGDIVRNLLGLAQLESQNRNVNFEKFDIAELLDDILPSFMLIIEKKEIILTKNLEEGIIAYADKFLIERVITNYISNACDHVDDNKKIEIALKMLDNQIYFSVFNTSDYELDSEKVWSSFYKSNDSKGNGLGLSIVKAIMESHNREYGFVNKDDGVEFYIKL